MPVQSINGLAEAGVIIDTPSISLPPNAFNEVRNVRFDNNAVVKMPGNKQVFDYDDAYRLANPGEFPFGRDLDQQMRRSTSRIHTIQNTGGTIVGPTYLDEQDDIIFFAHWPAPSASLYVFATTSRVFVINAAGEVFEVTPTDGTTDSGGNPNAVPFTSRGALDSSWQHTFAAGGYALIMNNGVDAPHFVQLEAQTADLTSSRLAPLPGWDNFYPSSQPAAARVNDSTFYISFAVPDNYTANTMLTFISATSGDAQPITTSEGVGDLTQFVVFADRTLVPGADYTLSADGIQFANTNYNNQTIAIWRNQIGGITFSPAFTTPDDYSIVFTDGDAAPSGAPVPRDQVTLTATNANFGVDYEQLDANLPKFRSGDMYIAERVEIACGVIRSFQNVLVAGRIRETDRQTDVTIRELAGTIRVSNLGVDGNIPNNWDPFSGAADTAEEFELAAASAVQDMVPLQGQLIIYSNDSIHGMALTGNINAPVAVSNITEVYGALAINCVAEFDGQHVVIGSNDIYVFPGHPGNIQSIADTRVRDYLYNNINPTYFDRIEIVRNRREDELWLCYPTYSSVQGDLDEALIWNYRFNTWTLRDLPNARGIDAAPITGGGVPSGRVEIGLADDPDEQQTGSRVLFPGSQAVQEFHVNPDAMVYVSSDDRPSRQRIYIDDFTPYVAAANEEFDIQISGLAGPIAGEATHQELVVDPTQTFMYTQSTGDQTVTLDYIPRHRLQADGTTVEYTAQMQSDSDTVSEAVVDYHTIQEWRVAQPATITPVDIMGNPIPGATPIPNPAHRASLPPAGTVTMREFWNDFALYVNHSRVRGQTNRLLPAFTTWGVSYNDANQLEFDSSVPGVRSITVEPSNDNTAVTTLINLGTGEFLRSDMNTHHVAQTYESLRLSVHYLRDGNEVTGFPLEFDIGYGMNRGDPQSFFPNSDYVQLTPSEINAEFFTQLEANALIQQHFDVQRVADANGTIRLIARDPGDLNNNVIVGIIDAFVDDPITDADQVPGYSTGEAAQTVWGASTRSVTVHRIEGNTATGLEPPPRIRLTWPRVNRATGETHIDFFGSSIVPAMGMPPTPVTPSALATRLADHINSVNTEWTATAVVTDTNRGPYVDMVADYNGPSTGFIEQLIGIDVSTNDMTPTNTHLNNRQIEVIGILPGSIALDSSVTPENVMLTFRDTSHDSREIVVTITSDADGDGIADAEDIAQDIANAAAWDTGWEISQRAGAVAQWVIPTGEARLGDRIIYTVTLNGTALRQRTIAITEGHTQTQVAEALRDDLNNIPGLTASTPGTAATMEFDGDGDGVAETYDIFDYARSSDLNVRSDDTTDDASIEISWDLWFFAGQNLPFGPEPRFNTSGAPTGARPAESVTFVGRDLDRIPLPVHVTEIAYGNLGNGNLNLNVGRRSTFRAEDDYTIDPFGAAFDNQDGEVAGSGTFSFVGQLLNEGLRPNFYGQPTVYVIRTYPILNADVRNNPMYIPVVVGNQDPNYIPRWRGQTTDPIRSPEDIVGAFPPSPDNPFDEFFPRDGVDYAIPMPNTPGLGAFAMPYPDYHPFDVDSFPGVQDRDTIGNAIGRTLDATNQFRVQFPSNQHRMFNYFAGDLENALVFDLSTLDNRGTRVINDGAGNPINLDRTPVSTINTDFGTVTPLNADGSDPLIASQDNRTFYDPERPWGEDVVNTAREFVVALDRVTRTFQAMDISLKHGAIGPGRETDAERIKMPDGTFRRNWSVQTLSDRLGEMYLGELVEEIRQGNYESYVLRDELIIQDEEYTKSPLAMYFRILGDRVANPADPHEAPDNVNQLQLLINANTAPLQYLGDDGYEFNNAFKVGYNWKVDTRLDGRILRYRISDLMDGDTLPQQFNWSLTALDVDVQQGGRR